MKIVYICVVVSWASTMWSYTVSGNTYVTNGSQSDVQAAVNAAPDNGSVTVVVPDGSYTWSGTLTINKAVALAGADATGVTLTNGNGGSDMIYAVSGTNGYTNIYWLNIVQGVNNGGTGKAFMIEADRVEPSNHTVLIHDCNFNQNGIYNYSIQCLANGIILWNDSFIASGPTGIGGISFVCGKYGYTGPGSYNTPDTFGTEDTTGLANSYVEDCSFSNGENVSNFQDSARVVWRFNTHQDAALGSHGQETGLYGVRAWEIYNNVFHISSTNPMNLNYWFQVRGGTGVVSGNEMDDIPWGKTGIQLNVFSITRGMNDGAGGEFCPLTYPAPRQTGWGWSASSNAYWGAGNDTAASRLVNGQNPGAFAPDGQGAVLNPVYVWGNTGSETTDPNYVGTQTYLPDNCGNGKTISTFLQENRDYYVNVAKPGWVPYTYPHPLHTQFAVK